MTSDVIYEPHYRRQPLVMGILNITHDSFSDGGKFFHRDAALFHVDDMIKHGLDVLDIGGESSRPGANVVSLNEELQRVIPVIEAIREHHDIMISVDTYKPMVMQAAIHAGADMINDITALKTPDALAMAATLNVPVCLMHMQNDPATMQMAPYYEQGVVQEINQFFSARIDACLAAGILRENLILDPGFGFGKTDTHNLTLMKHLSLFREHQLPLLLGVSRKNTIGVISGQPVTNRLGGGLGLAVFAALQGVMIIRTHDVTATRQALQLVNAVINVKEGE
jgi:dihydropteroate synthase